MPQIFSTSRAEAAVFRFPALFFPVAAVAALALQACLPVLVHAAVYLDLPLLIVVYWSLTSRNPAGGALVGAALGLTQDTVAHLALGLNGIAKTIIGWLGASLGARIDADHPGMRWGIVFVAYLANWLIRFAVERFMLASLLPWQGRAVVVAATVNAMLAVVVYWGMDRFRAWV